MKLLIVKPTALGDVAQALRVVPLLKSSGTAEHLAWVVDEDYAPLLRLCPGVDEIILFPRRKWRKRFCPSEIWNWGRELRKKRFDAVLDLQGLARSAWMTWVAGAPRRVGLRSAREGAALVYTETVEDRQTHAVDRYRAACEHLAGKPFAEGAEADPLRAEGPLPEGLVPGRYTVLHPYSKWETKLWPWVNYGLLAEAHPEETFVVIGQGELFPIYGPNIVDLRNSTPRMEPLLSLLGQARALISTDSGPAHVAAVLGCPVICLFGATDPERTAPRGRGVELLFEEISCQPCMERRCKNESKMACLRLLTMQDVSKNWQNLVKKSQFSLRREDYFKKQAE